MPETITELYREEQRLLHQNPNYGVASLSFAPLVANIIKQTGCKSVSDYGAGKKRLLDGLLKEGITPEVYAPYDPAFPEYGGPKSADIVCCIDVLEHIEPLLIDNVISELADITTNLGFFSIHLGPAIKTLTDGRNAHLIQEPSSWWLGKLICHFEILHLQHHRTMGKGLWVLVQPKRVVNEANS
jgi:hypothetical protein